MKSLSPPCDGLFAEHPNKRYTMKILIAFIVFAAISLFVIMKGGDKIDMSGEKHGTETHAPEPAAGASAPAAPASAPAASAAK